MPEEVVESQTFQAFPRYSLRSRNSAYQELARPCGRFRSPLSTRERLRLLLAQMFTRLGVREESAHLVTSGLPLNWEILLKYLKLKGIIADAAVWFIQIRNDLPKFFAPQMRVAWDVQKTDGRRTNASGYGHSSDAETAISKVIGETLERYFLTLYKKKDLYRASLDQMRSGVQVADMNAFLPWQSEKYGRLLRKSDSPLYWVRGETIDGKPAYIPAQCVFWNYDSSHDAAEPVLMQPTTSGAGGHFTKDEAVLSGLLELIQRDGFLIYWLNRISPKVIDVSDVDNPRVQELLALMDRYGLEMHFLDTTSDIAVPTVTCALIDKRGDEPILAIGGATGFDLEGTIVHAAYEALSVLNHVENAPLFDIPDQYKPFVDPSIDHSQRLGAWHGNKMLERFAFFLKGKRETPEDFLRGIADIDTPRAQLAYTRAALAALGKGYEIYIYEVRHAVLKKLGYHVVKVLVPQLIPLYLTENLVTLDSKRLKEVPEKLGLPTPAVLNPWPHPFP